MQELILLILVILTSMAILTRGILVAIKYDDDLLKIQDSLRFYLSEVKDIDEINLTNREKELLFEFAQKKADIESKKRMEKSFLLKIACKYIK